MIILRCTKSAQKKRKEIRNKYQCGVMCYEMACDITADWLKLKLNEGDDYTIHTEYRIWIKKGKEEKKGIIIILL